MKFKLIECKNNPDKIWIICLEENKHSSFLVSRRNLTKFLYSNESFLISKKDLTNLLYTNEDFE